jgi:hypothetical protein
MTARVTESGKRAAKELRHSVTVFCISKGVSGWPGG